VIAIILVLMALVVPMASTIGNADLEQGVELVQGKMSLARQTAIKENKPVEVRFYSYSDTSKLGEDEQFRALQYVQYDTDLEGNTTAIPKSKVEKLPGDIIIINRPEYSTLVTDLELQGASPVEIDPQVGDASYFSFFFLPNGSADLRDDVAGSWFLTIVKEADLIGTGGDLPSNYITLQVEPFPGVIRRLQPSAR